MELCSCGNKRWWRWEFWLSRLSHLMDGSPPLVSIPPDAILAINTSVLENSLQHGGRYHCIDVMLARSNIPEHFHIYISRYDLRYDEAGRSLFPPES